MKLNGFQVSSVSVMKVDGTIVALPSVGTFSLTPKEAAEDEVYYLSDMGSFSMTITFTSEGYERLLWLMGMHWLWRRYRKTLN